MEPGAASALFGFSRSFCQRLQLIWSSWQSSDQSRPPPCGPVLISCQNPCIHPFLIDPDQPFRFPGQHLCCMRPGFDDQRWYPFVSRATRSVSVFVIAGYSAFRVKQLASVCCVAGNPWASHLRSRYFFFPSWHSPRHLLLKFTREEIQKPEEPKYTVGPWQGAVVMMVGTTLWLGSMKHLPPEAYAFYLIWSRATMIGIL